MGAHIALRPGPPMGFLGWVLPHRTRPMGAHSAVYALYWGTRSWLLCPRTWPRIWSKREIRDHGSLYRSRASTPRIIAPPALSCPWKQRVFARRETNSWTTKQLTGILADIKSTSSSLSVFISGVVLRGRPTAILRDLVDLLLWYSEGWVRGSIRPESLAEISEWAESINLSEDVYLRWLP
jgi:hypothetical protein